MENTTTRNRLNNHTKTFIQTKENNMTNQKPNELDKEDNYEYCWCDKCIDAIENYLRATSGKRAAASTFFSALYTETPNEWNNTSKAILNELIKNKGNK